MPRSRTSFTTGLRPIILIKKLLRIFSIKVDLKEVLTSGFAVFLKKQKRPLTVRSKDLLEKIENSMIERFNISTKGHNDIIEITPEVVRIVKKSGVKTGICLISCSGSTCGITTIEYEPNLIKDFREFLEKLAPSDKDYYHNKTWSEKNAYSHLLSALFKPFLVVPIENGKLLLGQWQQIVFLDFDSRSRERMIIVEVS